MALSAGANLVTVRVTAEDGTTLKDYTVSVNRGVADAGGWQAGADLDGLIAAGNTHPRGVWSDGTTVWVVNGSLDDDRLYAYVLSSGARDAARDITLASSNGDPRGVWSDETTVWVVDIVDGKLYAYNLSSGSRDAARDITLDEDNNSPSGVWSDETTVWVADHNDKKLYAYALSDGARDVARDIDTPGAYRHEGLAGVWSDGTTIWAAGFFRLPDNTVQPGKVWAYRLSDGARDAAPGHRHAGGVGQRRHSGHLVGRDDDVGVRLPH